MKTNGRSAWLDAPAADSYRRMIAAGCPEGGITDAGRTYYEQAELYRLYLAGKLKATAAKPGTSKHETGRALDLDGAARAWVRTHGAAYGWMKDRVKNEPWHVEYEAAHDKQTASPAPEGDDMFNDTDRYALNLVLGAVGRNEQRLSSLAQQMGVALADIDKIEWGVLDNTAGARAMIAQAQVAIANLGASAADPEGGATPEGATEAILEAINALPAAVATELRARLAS